MKQQADGFRTTHTGSLPRPPALTDLEDAGQVTAAVEQLVRQQLEHNLVDQKIAWAKLAAMSAGAAIASKRLAG